MVIQPDSCQGEIGPLLKGSPRCVQLRQWPTAAQDMLPWGVSELSPVWCGGSAGRVEKRLSQFSLDNEQEQPTLSYEFEEDIQSLWLWMKGRSHQVSLCESADMLKVKEIAVCVLPSSPNKLTE